jgi:hypothetical protein
VQAKIKKYAAQVTLDNQPIYLPARGTIINMVIPAIKIDIGFQ